MAERVVSWQALANFSAIAKEARKARNALKELRAEQALLQAQSRVATTATPGSARATQATAAAGNAAADAARKTKALNDSQRDQVRAMREAENASRGTARGLQDVSNYAAMLSRQARSAQAPLTGISAALRRVSSDARSTSTTMDSTSSSMTTYARRARETETASDGAGRGINRFRSSLAGFSPQIKRDQVTILGLARAITLLTVPAVISFINALAASIPSLTAGLIGLAGALAPVTGLLGALPGLLAAAVGGVGTVIAGFAGIGGALKAYQTQQKAASKTSATASRQAQADANRRVAATRRVRKANDAVAEADENAADVARQNARRIADARRAVEDARRREAEVAVQSARQISNAERTLADARERAAEVAVDSSRSIENAQRNLSSAQRNAVEAQQGITEARRRAKDQIDDLKDSLRDLALQEEGTSLSVEEARLRLQRTLDDPGSTDLERRQAEFSVREAEARLGEVREQRDETDKALKDSAAKGIEGSDEVVEAREREADAQLAVRDAERDLIETRQDSVKAQRDAARAILDAQQGIRDAQRGAARDAADAARSTADAQRNLQDAYYSSAKATRDAKDRVAEANQTLGDLGNTLETSAIPAVDQFKEAMAKLTPEARAVVLQLIAMKPLIDQIRATAQKGLLPGVLVFLQESVKLFPLFNSFVGKVSTRFGEFFAEIGRAMTTQEAMKSWRNILDSTARVLDSFTDAGTNLVYILGDILEAGGPLTEWLAKTAEGWTESWLAMTKGEAGQRRLKRFFEDAAGVAKQLGRIVSNVAGALFEMGKKFRPVGQFILDGIEKITQKWEHWTESVEGQDSLEQWAKDAIITLGLMGDIIGGIIQAFRDLGKRVEINDLLITVRDRLVPALEKVMAIFTGELLNNLIIIASNIGDIIAAFGPEGQGALGAFTDALVLISGAMASLVKNKAAVAILTALLTAMAVKKVVGVVGTLTGVNNIAKSVQTVSKKRQDAGVAGKGSRVRRAAAFTGGTVATAGGLGGFYKPGFGQKPTAQPRRAVVPPPTRTQKVMSGVGGAARTAGTQARTVGTNIVGGIASGMNPKVALAKINSIVNSIIATAKKRLGIKSPSTVFQTIGRQIAEGLIKGISSMQGRATAAGAALSGAAVKGGKAGGVVVGGKGGKGAAKGGKKEKPVKGDGGMGKVAGGAMKAGGALGTLALVLSFLPGKVGEVAASLSTFIFILSLVGPALLKFGAVAGRVMLTLAKVVGRAMLIIGRAMMANPWMLLIGALILVVVLVIKYWDQIKAAVVKAAMWIFNWLKQNWPLLLKIILGPMGFLIVAIIKHWDQIKAVFFRAIDAIVAFAKRVWSWITKYIIDPIKIAFAWILAKTAEFRANFMRGINIIIAGLKRVWAWVSKYIIDPIKIGFAWVMAKIAEFRANFLRGVDIIIKGFKDRWNKAKGIVTDAIKVATDAAAKGLRGLRDKVSGWMDNIGDAWNKFKAKASSPISWVIDHVINGGIIKAYDWVANKLPGIGPIGPINNPLKAGGSSFPSGRSPTARKDGGIIPGRRAGGVLQGPGTGTSDSILGIDARGRATARVSAGEYVVREKVTRKNKPLLDAINAGRLGMGNFQKNPFGTGLVKATEFGKAVGGVIQKLNSGGLVGGMKNIPGLFLGGTAPIGGSWNRHSDYSFAQWAGDNPTPMGTPVRSWKAGTVAQVNRWNRSYGNHVWINHGAQRSLYAHLSAILTRVGEKVNAHELIGLSGSSGNSKGPHLHFEVRGGSIAQGADTGLLSSVLNTDFAKGFLDRVKGPLADLKGRLKGDSLSQLFNAGALNLKDKALENIKAKAKKFAESFSGFGAGDPGGTSGQNQALGKKLMLAAGFSESQWPALRTLWQNESGWNNKARNPSSGAYGIPQALPASKMGAAGASGNAEAQIRWGLKYIKDRYGSPSNALSAWRNRSPHWYARGTNSASPGYAIVGENGPEAVKFKGGERVVSNQKLDGYHSGGVVKGAKPGVRAGWVRGIRGQIPLNSSTTYFGSDLVNWIKKHGAPGVRDYPDTYKGNSRWLNSIATASKRTRSSHLSIYEAARAAKVDPGWLWTLYAEMKKPTLAENLTKRGVPRNKVIGLIKSIKSWGTRRTGDIKSIENLLGLPQDGKWDAGIQAPLAHILDHALGNAVGTYGHTATDPIPWDADANNVVGLLAEQIRSNALNAEYDRLLETFRSWGLNSVVRKFTEVGPADGLTSMRDLSKNKTMAQQYDDALRIDFERTDRLEDPTEQQMVKFMEAVRASVRPGLQEASKAASVSLDTGVKLYDRLTSLKRWGTVPTSKWSSGSRLYNDVAAFRNLFKFAGGGRVPGHGNRDSVPAILTPKEFVLRQAAASAIERDGGPGTLNYLNNYEKYANGGYVAAGMDTPVTRFSHPSEYGRRVAASHANDNATKVVNYNFDTTVHNPIREPASVSVQKRVQRVARLGLLAGDDKENQ